MSMTNVRYIHIQPGADWGWENYLQSHKLNGITVAYIRTDTRVYFAFAKCAKPDLYSKELGRIHSTRHLEEFLSDKSLQETIGEHLSTTFYSYWRNTGVITLNYVLNTPDFTGHEYSYDSVFADTFMNSLLMMDLKHAYLSRVISDFILEELSVKG